MAVKDYGLLEREDGARASRSRRCGRPRPIWSRGFRGVSDRDAAERLTNLKLFVPRERLPPPAADEFYHADLIGLRAVTADGDEVGTVVAVHDFGAGDLLELRPQAGGDDHPVAVHRGLRAGRRHCRRAHRRGAAVDDAARKRGDCCRIGPVESIIMWRASILTIFPDMFPGPLGLSLAGKALAAGLWTLDAVDIREHATDRHRSVDDTPGGRRSRHGHAAPTCWPAPSMHGAARAIRARAWR